MILLLAIQLALAHGGEEHAAPAAALPVAGSVRIAASNERIDAVLVLPEAHPGQQAATLLVADAETSAPLDINSAQLSLQGPAALDATLTDGGPGLARGELSFAEVGEYAGSAVLKLGDRAELLAITGLAIDLPAASAVAGGLSWVLLVVGALLLLSLGLGLGFGLGRLTRRAGAGLALLLTGLLRPAPVDAHGGEDHGEPGPPAAAGGALALPMESQFLLGLRTARVAASPFQERVAVLGSLVSAPDGAAALAAPVAGTLVAPKDGLLRPGSQVQAGQILASITETPSGAERAGLAAGRAEATAALSEAKTALGLAERDVAQLGELSDAISERERLDRQGRLLSAQTRAEQAQRAVDAYDGARVTVIRAPITGRVSEIYGRPGDTVQAGDPLLRIVGDGALWMVGRLPERQALALQTGADAMVRSVASDVPLPAQLIDAGLESDPQTGTVGLTLALDAQDLRPGLSASAWIAVGPSRESLVVSDAAVINSAGTTLVFVKTGPESFEARQVKLGARSGEFYEVLAGLSPGERVVTQATGTLRALAGR